MQKNEFKVDKHTDMNNPTNDILSKHKGFEIGEAAVNLSSEPHYAS